MQSLESMSRHLLSHHIRNMVWAHHTSSTPTCRCASTARHPDLDLAWRKALPSFCTCIGRDKRRHINKADVSETTENSDLVDLVGLQSTVRHNLIFITLCQTSKSRALIWLTTPTHGPHTVRRVPHLQNIQAEKRRGQTMSTCERKYTIGRRTFMVGEKMKDRRES